LAIECQSPTCGRRAPDKLQWRLLLSFHIYDLVSLFADELDALDCPYCGAKGTVLPSLAVFFLVECSLVVLDRGFDPEPGARQALDAIIDATAITVKTLRVTDPAGFKEIVAAKVKATAARFPYRRFSPATLEEDIANWRDLQGEVLSAMLLGALGIVPKFGVHAATDDGEAQGRDETLDAIRELVFWQAERRWVGLPSIMRETTLEEALIRLADTFGAVVLVADRLLGQLDDFWAHLSKNENGAGSTSKFYFLAMDASFHLLLNRKHPRAGEWALHYLAARCGVHGQDVSLDRDPTRLSSWRVRGTISYEHAWNAVAVLLASIVRSAGEDGLGELDHLASATKELGFEGLLEAVLQKGLVFGPHEGKDAVEPTTAGEDSTPQALAKQILEMRAGTQSLKIDSLVNMWRPAWLSDPAQLTHLYDLLEGAVSDDPTDRAGLLAWFGQRMMLLGAPSPVLERMGVAPADWELGLPSRAKGELWTERSNALRLAGEFASALHVARETLELTLSDPDSSAAYKATAWANFGILSRENGNFAQAEEALLRALEIAPEANRWHPLQSLAATYLKMGRTGEAAAALAAARETAGGPDLGDLRTSLLLAEIAARLVIGDRVRAENLLGECPAPEEMPDASLVPYVSVLGLLASRSGDVVAYRETAAAILPRLITMAEKFLEARNPMNAQNASHAAAILAYDFSLPGADALWVRDAEISLGTDSLPLPRTAIELAIQNIREDPDAFTDFVAVVRSSIAQHAAAVSLSSATISMLEPLDAPLKRLANLVFDQGLGPAAIQAVAELRRNAHRKAARVASGSETVADGAMAVAMAMRAEQPAFAVLEWCDISSGLIGILTHVAPGKPRAQFLSASPGYDLLDEASRIAARLSNWHSARAGEPFETEHWDRIRRDFCHSVCNCLPLGGHVVVIDHPNLSGFPFHIAFAPRWTVSYAADWSAVGSAVKAAGCGPKRPQLGVLLAPRSNETPSVRAALEASAKDLKTLARKKGLRVECAPPGEADAEAFRRLLERADLLKVLCHGQISSQDHQVYLLLDSEGHAPPGYSFGATLADSRRHRFGRDDLAPQKVAPRTIFLGACSSGTVSVAGLDERTSFATMLADAGTNAVVAPRWKIDAELALPVLDDALSRFLEAESLVTAVTFAAQAAAQRGVPLWQSHAFVVEGAWE